MGPPRGGAAILAVLVWRLGTGPFLDGMRTVDGWALAAAAGIGVLTTVCCAWRWRLVARGLGVACRCPRRSPPTTARSSSTRRSRAASSATCTAASATGATCSDVGRGLRAVVWERAAGQVVQAVLDRRGAARAAVAGALGRCRWWRSRSSLRRRVGVVLVARRGPAAALPLGAASARGRRPTSATGCSPAARWPGIVLASSVVVAGHAATFLIAARTAGVDRAAAPAAAAGAARAAGDGAARTSPAGGRARGWRRGRSARPGWARDAGVATAVVYGVHGARRQPARRRRARRRLARADAAGASRAAARGRSPCEPDGAPHG